VVSNLVSNTLESHAQVFPVLTEAQINRIRPLASLRHVNDGDVLFRADDSDAPFFILLSGREGMPMANASNTTAPTQFIQTKLEKYAYRRFGKGQGLPLLCLQHFTGTLDNWDPAVTDPLALGREVILFESAGLGRSTGQVPENMAGMAAHALAFVDVDIEAIRFLNAREDECFPVLHCSPYIQEWMSRERQEEKARTDWR
jgi:hypothetical protein